MQWRFRGCKGCSDAFQLEVQPVDFAVAGYAGRGAARGVARGAVMHALPFTVNQVDVAVGGEVIF